MTVDGQVSLASSGGDCAYVSSMVYDVRGDGVAVEVDLSGVPPTIYAYITFELVDGAGNGVAFMHYNGELRVYRAFSQSNWQLQTAQVLFNQTAHRWLRFREEDGYLYWEASPDGIAWSALHSADTASWGQAFDAMHVRLRHIGDTLQPDTTARFDNLNVPPGTSQ